jgi:rod shape-determining protein MreD
VRAWLGRPAALLVALVAQLALSSPWPGAMAFFDLPLLVVLYYALNRGPSLGLTVGGFVGLLQDALAGSLLGAGALSRSLVGYLTGSATVRFVLGGPFARFLVVIAATLAARLLEFFTLAVMGRHLAAPPPADLLAGIAGNGAAGAVLFTLFHRERDS